MPGFSKYIYYPMLLQDARLSFPAVVRFVAVCANMLYYVVVSHGKSKAFPKKVLQRTFVRPGRVILAPQLVRRTQEC